MFQSQTYPPPDWQGDVTQHKPRSLSDHLEAGERLAPPTPEEERALKHGLIDWKGMLHWRYWFRKAWIWHYVIFVVVVVLSSLITYYHDQIVEWLTPFTNWLHGLTVGWLVPVGILFVISFPPLFGHEIVAVLCGLVWGLGPGFGIVALGTLLGEIGNFYAFKYFLRSKAAKLEQKNLIYACLSKAIRAGGFKIAVAARLSIIPGHFTTAIFATSGMGIITFVIAAILSLPKQFITVYLGVMLNQSGDGAQPPTSQSKIITKVVLGVTLAVTFLSLWFIIHEMNKVKVEVITGLRAKRWQEQHSTHVKLSGSIDAQKVGLLSHSAEEPNATKPYNPPKPRPISPPRLAAPWAPRNVVSPVHGINVVSPTINELSPISPNGNHHQFNTPAAADLLVPTIPPPQKQPNAATSPHAPPGLSQGIGSAPASPPAGSKSNSPKGVRFEVMSPAPSESGPPSRRTSLAGRKTPAPQAQARAQFGRGA